MKTKGRKIMNNQEFMKLANTLDLLALNNFISDKKKLLKYEIYTNFSEEELNSFIKLAQSKKILLKNLIKEKFNLTYAEAIKYAKENEETYKELYNLLLCNRHNFVVLATRNRYDEYLDNVKRYYKPTAKNLLNKYVGA